MNGSPKAQYVSAPKAIAIVLFGITGDLARAKLVPTLYKLFIKGLLPQHISFICYGRREFTDDQFALFVRGLVQDVHFPQLVMEKKESYIESFIKKCRYVQGHFDRGADYERLQRIIQSQDFAQVLYYLSIPPDLHSIVIEQLGWAELLQDTAKVLIEKPFGENETSAKELDAILKKFLPEESIYRIDHYLHKEGLLELEEEKKGILFQHFWNDIYIEKVEIVLHEEKGIGGRLYDEVGALRDVGQNHLLQMLASVVANHPVGATADEISRERFRVLKSIEVYKNRTMRGQYVGYLEEQNVKPTSTTETFFSAELRLTIPKWKNTIFHISTGKGYPRKETEILITFRNFDKKSKDESFLQISLDDLRDPWRSLEAYEYVFLNAIKGDRTLFISLGEAIAGWKFVKKLKQIWKAKKVALIHYKKGTTPVLKY